MRRWLAVILLALMSVQSTWAVVAPYCEHEPAQVGHFGHHEHPHPAPDLQDADGAAASGASGLSSLGGDPDCGQCHGGCALLAPFASGVLDVLPMVRPIAMAALHVAAGRVERPERPKWSSPA